MPDVIEVGGNLLRESVARKFKRLAAGEKPALKAVGVVRSEYPDCIRCGVGSEMLAIHAARLFLSTTALHTSNVLVDTDGRLFSIDHVLASVVDGAADLRVLFGDLQPATRALEATRAVAELSEEKLRELFEELPVPAGARWLR